MLEAVVEDDRVAAEARAREPRGLDATFGRHDRQRQPRRGQRGFVTAVGGID
jgi:hypothetical protein